LLANVENQGVLQPYSQYSVKSAQTRILTDLYIQLSNLEKVERALPNFKISKHCALQFTGTVVDWNDLKLYNMLIY
jgi:hypothetical protein